MFEHPTRQYALFKAFEAQVEKQAMDGVPEKPSAAVRQAVAEHSLNPQDIETSIRKALLPALFASMGLDRAKDAIEQVIQVTRVGLRRGASEMQRSIAYDDAQIDFTIHLLSQASRVPPKAAGRVRISLLPDGRVKRTRWQARTWRPSRAPCASAPAGSGRSARPGAPAAPTCCRATT